MKSPAFRKPLRWLHLSDFHLKGADKWSQDVVLQTLLDDISNRYSVPNSVDFIFITGDLAYSGKSEEYILAEEFINQLLMVTGVCVERLMMVPGNHDINRNTEIDAFRGARSVLNNAIEVDKILGDEARRRTILRRQREFREFSNRVYKRDVYSETSYQHAIKHNFCGLNVSVLLIDSSWLSEGGRTDSHRILVGERQLIDLSKTLTDSSLTIGLMHHPLDWLAPFEHSAIKNLLTEQCQLLLRGHVHEDSVETISQSGNQMKVFTAGASYESRLSANCYGFGAVDLFSGDGECVIHKYRNNSKTWEKQESVTWTLTDQYNFSITFTDFHDPISLHTPPYPAYLACLVGQKVTEVPVRYGKEIVFLAMTDSLAHSTPIAKSVRQLRHVIHWRDCWNQEDWQAAMSQMVDSYSNAISECENNEETKLILMEREEQSKKIVESLHDSGNGIRESNQAIAQALELVNSGFRQMAVSILRRVVDQNEISNLETLSAFRILTKIHLAEDRTHEALEASEKMLSFSEAIGSDYLIAATCYLNAGDMESAKRHVETASTLGMPFSQIRGVATRIAGLTGDGQLLTRLRESND